MSKVKVENVKENESDNNIIELLATPPRALPKGKVTPRGKGKVSAERLKVENVANNESEGNVIELLATPPRAIPKRKIAPEAAAPQVARATSPDIQINVYTDVISDVRKTPKHLSIEELEPMFKTAPKYFHIHITHKGTSDRLHVWAVKSEDKTSFAISNFSNGHLLEHTEVTNPTKYIKDFIAAHQRMAGGSRRAGGYKPTPRNLAALRKWRAGKSIGFTMRSSLKAKGLIPRSNGTRRVSPKYK